ncbi:MAG: hypothetical protein WCH99_10070 [Verrucomicrobiota bacterium]|jgi:hypothetical protein
MKNTFIVLLALLGLLTLSASAQVYSTTLKPAVTNSGSVVYTSTSTTFANPTNIWVDVGQGKPLGIYATVTANGAGTSNSVLTCEVTVDGTNALASPVFALTFAMNGTSAYYASTNVAAADISNYKKIRIKSLTSTTIATNTAKFWFVNY